MDGCRKGMRGREGMVFLHAEGQEVCDGDENKQSDGVRVLEGNGKRQKCPQEGQSGWHAKDFGFLSRKGSQRHQDPLGHA